ncbi:hypothetical protein ACIBF1_26190 [Spirillospora sp. NPDC050679]
MSAVTVGTLAAAAGCGEPADDPGTSAGTSGGATAAATPGGPAATPASPSGKQDVTNITVTVSEGKVRTGSGRVKVKRGATVRVTITSDAADEFHLHGYDRTVDLRPGRPGTLELTADKPGVFEAELHHSGARVFELQVG